MNERDFFRAEGTEMAGSRGANLRKKESGLLDAFREGKAARAASFLGLLTLLAACENERVGHPEWGGENISLPNPWNSEYQETVRISYRSGDSLSLKGIEDLGEKNRQIAEGLNSVYGLLGFDRVDTVAYVAETEVGGPMTYAHDTGRNMVYFPEYVLREFSQEALNVAAEHEAFHAYINNADFFKGEGADQDTMVLKAFWEVAADPRSDRLVRFSDVLHYFSLEADFEKLLEHKRQTGSPISRFFYKRATVDAGYDRPDDPVEFTTNLMHSLQHIDRFEENLSRPLRVSSREHTSLTSEEKLYIIDSYIKMVEAMREFTDQDSFDIHGLAVNFYDSRLETLRRMRERIAGTEN